MIGICLPPVVALVVWLVSIDAKASSAHEAVTNIRELLLDVRERVIRIEEHQKRGN